MKDKKIIYFGSAQQGISQENLNFDEIWGKKVCSARLKAGINQSDLAKGVGLGRTSITNIELGKQKLSLENAIKIFTALGVKLIDEKEVMKLDSKY